MAGFVALCKLKYITTISLKTAKDEAK